MRILVTGGAGFIGVALVKRLVKAGHNVVVLDNCSRGKRANLDCGKGVHGFYGDVREYNRVALAMEGCEEVIHLAYVNGTKTFYEQPDVVLDVGVAGMLNVLKACTEHNVKRMMLVSSSEVCRAHVAGMDEQVPLVIPDPFNPRYSYSAGKIISEIMAIHHKGFDWLTILRPFNIYGPGMSKGHVIPDFKDQLVQRLDETPNEPTLPFEILGDGAETRSFCYIDDFIDGMMLVREKGVHRGIYNVGTPEEVTIRSLAQRMGEFYNVNLKITEGNKLREGSITRRKPDISKLQVLGYVPKVPLVEGLRRVLCQ